MLYFTALSGFTPLSARTLRVPARHQVCGVCGGLNFPKLYDLVRLLSGFKRVSGYPTRELASGLLVLAEGGGEQPQQRLHLEGGWMDSVAERHPSRG